MQNKAQPLEETTATDPSYKQRIASTPSHSVWVDASAGTGKTKVLTDRVLRFLLQGIAPSKILCLTFTKAAAAEMHHRIFENLQRWSTCPRADLVARLTDLLGQGPSPQQSARARVLFLQLIDDPYGLKVLTIHSFCQQVLGRFPVEAGLPLTTQLIDPDDQNDLLQQAADRLILEVAQNPLFQGVFSTLSSFYRPQSLPGLLKGIIVDPKSKRHLKVHSMETLVRNLEEHFGMPISKTKTSLLQDHALKREVMVRGAKVLEEGSVTEQQQSKRFAFFIKNDLTPETFDRYFSIFCTQKGEPRKALATQKTLKAHPWLADFFHKESEGILDLQERVQRWQALQCSYGLTLLAQKMLEIYTDLKGKKAVLDFDDLISTSADLLSQNQGVSWVLYKLDGGVDHILVDEAQDTSPDQWQIILKLAEDFFAGETARRLDRTLFVVGDRKQSIYSFQGAEPDLFQHLRYFFQDRIDQAQQSFQQISLDLSFRSCRAVLSLVDDVFANLDTDLEANHESFRALDGGKVSLWPLIPYEKGSAEQEEYAPSPSQILATQIAQNIKERLVKREELPAKGRPVQAGDFLILVQRRSAFMYQVIRALKRQNVPVAGPDRFALMEHLAVQDLMALASFLLLPEDDYALACLLKSPLFNLSEQELIVISTNREGKSLWAALSASLDHKGEREWLASLLKKVDQLSPHALFTHVLTTLKGRQKFRARLSDECDDVLDEFLNLAGAYGQRHGNGLQGFVVHCQKTSPEIKRDFSSAALNAVRIMTVHGAKGLQAPIVFLPDTTRVPNQYPLVMWHETRDKKMVPLWRPPATISCERILPTKDQAEAKQVDEYYRLLYVALTRAEDELIIAGWETFRQTSDQCWYYAVEPSLRRFGEGKLDGRVVYECPQQRVVKRVSLRPVEGHEIAPSPAWMFENPPSEIGEAEPLSPSAFLGAEKEQEKAGDETYLSLLQEGQKDPYAQGLYIHKLLEVLPGLESNGWMSYGKNEATSRGITDFEADFEAVKKILENETFCDVFGPHSFAEVSVSGEAQGHRFNGQIDRLIVTDKTVTIIDFKSNKIVPQSLAEVPQNYLGQMEIYKELVQKIYPSHDIHCELIWVRTQQRMVL